MPTSISKAQASALADGFLDSLGSSKDELQPKETMSALYQLAGSVVMKAQENLTKADRVSTGELASSIKVLNPEVVGKTIRIDIEAAYYYQFIDKGVKGTRSGSGQFSFKNEFVGKKMQEAIRKWVIRERIKMTATKKYKAISKREAKRKKIGDTSRATAYAIATRIKMKGLKKTNFFSKAIADVKATAKEDLGKAFKIDVINALPKRLEEY